MNRILFILFFIFILFSVRGQNFHPYRFNHITTDDGLTNNAGFSIIQDIDGFMWLGTFNGLNRFDGAEIKNYSSFDDNTPIKLVLTMFINSKGLFFVSTLDDLIIYDKKNDKFISLHTYTDQNIIVKHVFDFVELENGNLFIVATEGIFYYNSSDNKIQKLNFSGNEISARRTVAVQRISNEEVFLSSLDKVCRYNVKTKKVTDETQITQLTANGTTKDDVITRMLLDRSGNLWIGTGFGRFFRYYVSSKQLVEMKYFESTSCNFIYQETDSTILVSFDYLGLIRFNFLSDSYERLYDQFNDKKEIGNNKIISIFVDRDRILWLGHGHIGFSYASIFETGFRGINYNKNKDFDFPVVSAILKDSKGQIWIGTDGGGIVVYDANLKPQKKFKANPNLRNSLPENAVLSIFEDSYGEIWIGTYRGGLSKYNHKTNDFSTFVHNDQNINTIGGNDIRKIIEDKAGNIWVAIHGKGMSMFNRKTNRFTNYNDFVDTLGDFHNLWSFDIEPDSKGNIWLSNFGGVLLYDVHKNVYTDFSIENPDKNKSLRLSVNAMHCDSKGKMWFCSDHGLFEFNDKTKSFIEHTELPKLSFTSIEEDKNGVLWIGSEKGLFMFNPQSKYIVNFTKKDGLQGNEFMMRSSFSYKGEYLYFGTTTGFDFFSVEKVTSSLVIPRVHLLKVSIMGEEKTAQFYDKSQKLILPFDKNFISFQYTAVNFLNPERNVFMYKLDGLEENWNGPVGEKKASYTSLPPGDYLFRLHTVNSNGTWNNKSETFAFTILAPWWSTWWFRLSVSVFIVFMFFVVHRLRTRIIKKQNRELDLQVQLRTNEIKEVNLNLIRHQQEIQSQSEEIKIANDKLEEKQRELEESLRYAQSIQDFMTPSISILKNQFADSFLFHKPRDIVSGDFFWAEDVEKYVVFVVADCTGHGVPGAMLSMIGISMLDELVKRQDYLDNMCPATLLEELRILMKIRFYHKRNDLFHKEGMDMAICVYNKETQEVKFSGANNPLIVVKDNQIITFKTTKNPIGVYYREQEFECENVDVQKGDMLYLFSDGYADQFNGDTDKKLKSVNFKNLLLSIHSLSCEEQHKKLDSFLHEWMGTGKQIDDIMVLGVRL